MKFVLSLSAVLIVSAIFSFFQNNNKLMDDTNNLPDANPFSKASTLPYQAPDFTKIKEADFKPALEEGILQQLKEVATIAENPAAPTFENTLVELEKTGQLFTRVYNVFNLLTGANTNDVLQALQEEIAPQLAANQDAVYLNTQLFRRIETIYNNRSNLHLDAESLRLLEYQYQAFVLAGAQLSDAD